MNNKISNIDEDFDFLKETDLLLPGENFKTEIIAKLKKTKNERKSSFLKTGGIVILMLIINFFSVFTIFDFHSKTEREMKLKTVINSFSLDK